MEVIKRIPTKVEIVECLIEFCYETQKTGRYRKQKRIVRGVSKEMCIDAFNLWVRGQRTMANVDILAVEEINKSVMEL